MVHKCQNLVAGTIEVAGRLRLRSFEQTGQSKFVSHLPHWPSIDSSQIGLQDSGVLNVWIAASFGKSSSDGLTTCQSSDITNDESTSGLASL